MTTELLTEPEAAKVLRVCTRTLRKARKAGKLHYVLIGGAIRYTPDDVKQFVESCRTVGTPCTRKTAKRAANTRHGNIVPFSAR